MCISRDCAQMDDVAGNELEHREIHGGANRSGSVAGESARTQLHRSGSEPLTFARSHDQLESRVSKSDVVTYGGHQGQCAHRRAEHAVACRLHERHRGD